MRFRPSWESVITSVPVDAPVKFPVVDEIKWPDFAYHFDLAHYSNEPTSRAIIEASPIKSGEVVEIYEYGWLSGGTRTRSTKRFLVLGISTSYLSSRGYSVPEYYVVPLVKNGKRWSRRVTRIYPGSFRRDEA